MSIKDIKTYRDLRDYLATLTDEQLSQRVQVIPPSADDGLQPVHAIGTVAEMELEASRSSVDNRYHAEEVVLHADHNPFGQDGAIAYEMTGRDAKPIYGSYGKTNPADQRAPVASSKEAAK